MESCQNNAREIRLGSREYANNLLEEVENFLIEQVESLEGTGKNLKI